VAAAIRFFYVETLDWPPLKLHLPPRPAPKRLLKVLSLEDVERLLICTHNPKHRALLMTTYAAGLRVSEVVHLQVTDIESHPERMLIRINQGKGQKDRYTLLSTPPLTGTARLLASGAADAVVISWSRPQTPYAQRHGGQDL
jgi:site-specific recombinase XerD